MGSSDWKGLRLIFMFNMCLQPLMLVVPDVQDVYTPLQTDVVVQLSEVRLLSVKFIYLFLNALCWCEAIYNYWYGILFQVFTKFVYFVNSVPSTFRATSGEHSNHVSGK